MPHAEPRRAVEAVTALSDRLAARVPFGFLDPPFRAIGHWQYKSDINTIRGVKDFTPRSDWTDWDFALGTIASVDCVKSHKSAVVINWHWRVLWRTDDWYEIGWHPSDTFLALWKGYADQLWDCLNPGKRPLNSLRKS